MLDSGFRRAATTSGALLAALAMASVAAANTLSPDYFKITATNDEGSASAVIATGDVTYDPVNDQYQWSTPGFTLWDGPTPVAELGPTTLNVLSTPSVIFLNFDVDAGLSDTVFTIQTATVNFPAIANPEASVSGAINVADTDEFGGSVLLTGLNPDGPNPAKAFLAQYNGTVPTGTTFFAGVESLQSDTTATSGPFGLPLSPIGEPLTDFSMQFSFTLSATDNATGNAVYRVIPEPATAGLMLLAGGLLGRRRH